MLVRLERDADPKSVQAALQGLGLWCEPLAAPDTSTAALSIKTHSAHVARERIAQIRGVAQVLVEASAHPLVDAQAGRAVAIASHRIGGQAAPMMMAGPCSVESSEQIQRAAAVVAAAGATLLRGGAFKPRSSPYSFSGHGAQALRWLRRAADAHGLGVVTEALSETHVDEVAEHADLIQIGSRNMQNFALLAAAGRAGRPVLLKRGMAATVKEWLLSGEHVLASGAPAVVFCERGISSFDPCTRNLLDLGSVALLRQVHQQPVVVAPSHALGRHDLIVPLARAAIACGQA